MTASEGNDTATAAAPVTKPAIRRYPSKTTVFSSPLSDTSPVKPKSQPATNSTTSTSNHRSEPKLMGNPKRLNGFTHSSSNGSIVSLATSLNSSLSHAKKANSNSNSAIHTSKPHMNRVESLKQPQSKPQPGTLVSIATLPLNADLKQECDLKEVIQVEQQTGDELISKTESAEPETCTRLEEESCSSSVAAVQPKAEANSVVAAVAAVVAPVKLTEEEEYKKKLEEKRREAREKAAKEAELERQRLELIRLDEEKRQREEEEQERLAEEEFLHLNRLAREQEETRLRNAIELNERLENERRLKEENERKLKEQNEQRAKSEAERLELLRIEKNKKEESERQERRRVRSSITHFYCMKLIA